MIIKTSNNKIKDSVLLIVDVESQYLKRNKVEFIQGNDNKDIAIDNLNKKMQNLPSIINSIINPNENIYVLHKKELHSSLSLINYKDLGDWEENDSWIKTLKKTNKKVVICGMWKELCCLEVYTQLYDAGVACYILNNEHLTFSLSLYGSPLPFEMKVSMFGYKLENIN